MLLFDYPYYGNQILEFIDILVETCCSERPTIRIGKEEKPTAIVKSRLMKLNSEHIRYVIDRIHDNTTDVRNIKQYLLTTLYNVLSGKLIAAPNCKLKQTFWNQPLLKQSHCLLVIQHDI